MAMNGLAEPPHRWDAETATPPVLETLTAAVGSEVDSMVKAGVRRLEPWIGFKNGCVVFPRQVGSCAERVRSLMESGMDDRVRRYIDQSMVVVGQHAADMFDQWLWRFLPDCESEIERLLCAAFLLLEDLNRIGPCYRFHVTGGINGLCRPRSFAQVRQWAWSARFDPYENRNYEVLTYCYPQVTFEPYRVDFLIGSLWSEPDGEDRREHWIAVECDGHDFHEKTKEQAQRDKARDRFLVSSGVKVMRFTGSEIWRDPTLCAIEVLRAVDPETSWVTGGGE
jgi:very-short-patch-repair endonuclease